ncbi:GNAT family N-acetyltransferase [Sphingomonas sp. R-74633]|uniref:GNAT family N-acetyltransferase n=1 Tax=Sphingomonas sp. R-74633 TaxID=2751188 RepID=UPI001C550368
MTNRVIQGFFVGGQARSAPGVARPAAVQRATTAGPQQRVGAPAPAFGGGAAAAQAFGGTGSFEIDPTRIGLVRNGGRQLPEAVLAKMEAAFGADFSAVRVHVGPQAARIGAVAFTTGNDLYFAQGRYQPDSVQGQQLIGHELAHVVQQRQGRVRAPGNGVAVVQDHALEAEADRLGQRAAMHRVPVQAKPANGAAFRPQGQPLQRHAGLGGGNEVRISAPMPAGNGSYRLSAKSGTASIGSVTVHTRGRGGVARITDLNVSAEHRDQGIGKMLLASAARASMARGNARVSLHADDTGSGKLNRWYKSIGFMETGGRQGSQSRFEASALRVASAVAQRRTAMPGPPVRPGLIQRASAVVVDTSGFSSTSTTLSGQIYGIWKNEQYPNAVQDSSLSKVKCLYVGKTNPKVDGDYGARFYQHCTKDADKPWFVSSKCSYGDDAEKWPYIVRQLWAFKDVTCFDVAVAEQYYHQEWASPLNKIRAITPEKFAAYKDDHSIFTTHKGYPSTWKPI